MKPNCTSCAAPLRWVKTPKGKWLQLDAEPAPEGEGVILLEQTLWGETSGRVVPKGQGSHLPHWASCPDADSFRRPVTTGGRPRRSRRRREPS
jgi:hypothetical protein